MQRVQWFMPQQLITEFMGKVGDCPRLAKLVIGIFSRLYKINLNEAEVPAEGFKTFNEFFTRALKPGARPTANADFVSPADGTLSEFGAIQAGQLLQAKGVLYSEQKLLNNNGGYNYFATVYLAPHNYHHVHAPCDFVVTKVQYIPGKLFSVSIGTTNKIKDLFARNERLVIEGQTPHGKMAYVMVGAMCVAGIETELTGRIKRSKQVQNFYAERAFAKGERIGSFCMGSTVILLTEADLKIERAAGEIMLGQALSAHQR